MELRHIRYFIAVAEELHFGRAAVRLGIAQPPLSQQIKQLEVELGVTLLARTSRRVRLTPAGEDFLIRSRAIIQQSHQLVESAQAIHAGRQAVIQIGVNETTIDLFLGDIVKKLRRDRPGVVLRVHEMQTTDQLEAIRTGRIDIGFMRLFKHDLTGLRSRLLLREPYLLAVPKTHRLGVQKRINLKSLDDEGLIPFPRSIQPGLYDELMACFALVGVTPKIVQQATTKHTTLSLVAAGIGFALIPKSSALHAPKAVAVKPIMQIAKLPPVEHFVVWCEGQVNPLVAEIITSLPKP